MKTKHCSHHFKSRQRVLKLLINESETTQIIYVVHSDKLRLLELETLGYKVISVIDVKHLKNYAYL